MRNLLALRHGITETNEKRIFSGAKDVPLSDNGREALMKLSGTYPQATTFFTSGMIRAEETLSILYGNVPHIIIPELSEYRFGDFEMRSHAELYDAEPIYREWLDLGKKDIICPGGESRRMFEERIDEGLKKLLMYRWQDLAVLISHGGVLASMIRRFMPDSEGFLTPENGQGYRFFFADNGSFVRYERYP